eukprot:SAG11_NODE_10605_length_817_cov_1.650418_1_plen_63_part_00
MADHVAESVDRLVLVVVRNTAELDVQRALPERCERHDACQTSAAPPRRDQKRSLPQLKNKIF